MILFRESLHTALSAFLCVYWRYLLPEVTQSPAGTFNPLAL